MFKVAHDLLATAFLAPAAGADNLYRYKNDAGGTGVDWQVPAQFAGRGDEVLNTQGDVVEVVPRQLRADESPDKDLAERLTQDAVVE